jgi:hypothetical protein
MPHPWLNLIIWLVQAFNNTHIMICNVYFKRIQDNVDDTVASYRMGTEELWLISQQMYDMLVCGQMEAHQTRQKMQSLSVRTQIHAVVETSLVPHYCQLGHILACTYCCRHLPTGLTMKYIFRFIPLMNEGQNLFLTLVPHPPFQDIGEFINYFIIK